MHRDTKNSTSVPGTKSLKGKPVSVFNYEPPSKWIDRFRSSLSDEEEEDEEELDDSE